MISTYTLGDVHRFYRKVPMLPRDECWIWQGYCDPKWKYGIYTIRHKIIKAHRFAYWEHTKQHPGLLDVLHRCDNPPCVNPHHLFLGTHTDNMLDSVAKSRMRHVLDWPEVREIRRLYATGNYTLLQLGNRFNVSFSMIGRIVRNEEWKE
jgi:hypothetical protein